MKCGGTKTNTFGECMIVADSTPKMTNEADNDDNFDIYEIVSRDITPANSSLNYYMKSVDVELLNDLKGTTGPDYGTGDKRGNPAKRYKDVLTLYNYIRQNLKLADTKALFDRVYKGVIDDMFSKNGSYDIVLEELKMIGYVPVFPMDIASCSGYVIYIYRDIGTRTVNCGYIYVKHDKGFKVIPFSNGKERSLGRPATVNGKLKEMFITARKGGFKETSLEDIFAYTTRMVGKTTSDPGFSFVFTLEGVVDAQIKSIL